MKWLATVLALGLVLLCGWMLRDLEAEGAGALRRVAPPPAGRPAASTEPELLAPDGTDPGAERTEAERDGDAAPVPGPGADSSPPDEFHGRVLSESDGRPVDGIAVEPAGHGPGGADPVAIETGANGTFVVRHGAPAGQPLSVRAPGFAPALLLSDAVHETPEHAAEIRLGPAATLAARVVDALGAGMAGVDVGIRAEALDLRASSDLFDRPYEFDAPDWRERTDSRGDALFVDLPPAVMLTAELTRDGETLLLATEPLYLTPGRRDIVWSIGAGTLVTGRVRTEDGSPVAGVEVWRLSAGVDMAIVFRPDMGTSVAAKARTDDDGFFAMADVAAGGWWIGLAPGPDYVSIAEHLVVERGVPSAEVDVVACAHLTIAGRIVDPEGRPVPNARVVANRAGTLIYLTADISNGDGSFALGPAVPGAYEISAGSGGGDLRGSEKVVVQAGDQDVILAMRRGGVIRGWVLDALTREPAPAAIVSSAVAEGREFAGFQRIATHSVEFELGGLTLGEYWVVAHTADGRIGVARTAARPLEEAREPLEVRVERGTTLVVRSTGELGGSYQVWWGDVILAMNGIAAGGRIELTAPPGEVWVRWRPRGTKEYVAERRVDVSAGERREVPFDDAGEE